MWRKSMGTPWRRIRLARLYSAPTESRQAPQVLSTATKSRPLVPPVVQTSKSWSSPHDGVSRNVYASDYAHAWTLLEACLENNYMERAESILLGFVDKTTEKTDICLALNNYLLKLVGMNAGNPDVATAWLARMKYFLKSKFEQNTVTDAIMLKNAYLADTKEPLRAFMDKHRDSLPQILSHVEVLGVNAIKEIIESSAVDLRSLDPKVRALVESHAGNHTGNHGEAAGTLSGEAAAPAAPAAAEGMPPSRIDAPIEKEGFETLTPTQSVGLKGIRHILTGLKLDPKDEQENQLLPLLQEKSSDGDNFVDFFEMSRHVRDEDREEFEKSLDQVNERRQQAIETRGVEAARMKWKDMFDRMVTQDRSPETKVQLKGLEMLLWQWHQQMMPLIQEEYARIDELLQYETKNSIPKDVKAANGKAYSDRFDYGPYLKLAKPENIPAMTMMELLRLNSTKGLTDGIRSVKAVLEVGKNVELDYRLRSFKTKEREALKGSNGRQRSRRALSNLRTRMRQLSLENKQNSWPTHIRAKIGSLLISLFLRVAKVPVYGTDPVTGQKVKGKAPAFYHTYQYQNGNKVGVLRPHKNVSKYLTGESTAAVIQPQQLPMLIEPRPWTAWNQGGYYYSTSKIIRTKNSPEQLAYVTEASKRGQLDSVYEGLNVLGRTPWTINKDMFKIISRVWNTEQPFLDIPPNVQPQPSPTDFPPEPPRDCDPQVRRDWLRECRRVTLEQASLYSQRCDLNYKLDIARAYLGERFYLPHNLDFRGRAYALSPHLNHLGNDVSRSLLMFWRGKKLGPNGLRWLKIHAANLYGNSKKSHEERVQFIDDNLAAVMESAKEPLDGEGWWKSADEPFQFLAACIEITRAIDSGNPEEYVSHISVHQDGSCNGLQHYAALGGDFEGAKEVNLMAAERPQDVYSRVLEIVKVNVTEDADNGNDAAKSLLPFLSRKVVKQTVMTHVYGVTFIGAREQIASRLRDIDLVPQDKIYAYSSYLAEKVLAAVRQLFESAHLIQDWLGENASRISHSIVLQDDVDFRDKRRPEFLSSVIWTTPMGLPIVQPYRQSKRKQVVTELQTVFIEDPYAFQGVNSRKQRTAFPPNYIHSLDATHMLSSAISCAKSGIDFASVHDSYWTHAADVETMNQNLRESFVDLHSKNLIEGLRTEFQQRYAGLVQWVEIRSDSPVAERIKEARKRFSLEKYGSEKALTVMDQIEMEKERLRKIGAGEPALETPVSIVNELNEQELDKLISEGARERKQRQAKAVSRIAPRSTEHEGSGLDVVEDDATDDVDEEVFTSSGGPLMSVLVPLRVPQVPTRGEFEVKEVLNSPYFFS